MKWKSQEEVVVCCQEEGYLQRGDVVSVITGERSTISYCFEHKGASYILAAGRHFTFSEERDVFMFVSEQNQIKTAGIEVSRTLHSALFRINTTLVSVKPSDSVLLPTKDHSRDGKPLPFGTLLYGVFTRSKDNLTGMVAAPVLSPQHPHSIGLRSVVKGDEQLNEERGIQHQLMLPLTEPLDSGIILSDDQGVDRYVHVLTRFHWKTRTYDSICISLEYLLTRHIILSEHAGVEFAPQAGPWIRSPHLDHWADVRHDYPYWPTHDIGFAIVTPDVHLPLLQETQRSSWDWRDFEFDPPNYEVLPLHWSPRYDYRHEKYHRSGALD